MEHHSETRIRITPELKDAIDRHNRLIVGVYSEHKHEKDAFEDRMNSLVDAHIEPEEELKGGGLRRTFVDLGRQWLLHAFLRNWEEQFQHEKQEQKMGKVEQLMLAAWKPVLCCFMALLLITVFIGLLLGNGRKAVPKVVMQELPSDERYVALEHFTQKVLSDYSRHGEYGLEDKWSDITDPEIRYWSLELLKNVRNIGAVRVCKIYLDPARDNIFHIYCRGVVTDPQLRIQCCCVGNKVQLVYME